MSRLLTIGHRNIKEQHFTVGQQRRILSGRYRRGVEGEVMELTTTPPKRNPEGIIYCPCWQSIESQIRQATIQWE